MAPPPPALPSVLTNPKLPVRVGIGIWLLCTLVLGGAWLLGDRPLDVWFWTAIAGWALGLIGFAVMAWQRSAVRRGSRSAQSGLL